MLAENIKINRKKLELSQEELAKKANITYSTLIKLESGANDNPTVKTIKLLSEALNVSIDKLLS